MSFAPSTGASILALTQPWANAFAGRNARKPRARAAHGAAIRSRCDMTIPSGDETVHRLPAPLKLSLALLGLIGLGGCGEPSAPMEKAHARFAYCSPCHGENGGGNATLGAPSIAGLPQWYIEAQLGKFRTGVRGTHPDDMPGMRMRPMSLTLHSEDDIKLFATYISSLPFQPSAPTIADADASKGAAAFALCSACHQANGSGMEALKSPPISGQADWYILESLRKYKGGIRGSHPDDISGGQMRAIAMSLTDEQAMKDLAAHVSSMPRN